MIVYMSGNSWTNFVKEFAKENNIGYMAAIKNPELAESYKSHKKSVKSKAKQDNFEYLKKTAIEMASQNPTEDTPNIQYELETDS